MNIRSTGVRSYERITSSATGRQCKGTIMILRSENCVAYPAAKAFVSILNHTDIRDALNSYAFFAPLSVDDRYKYLRQISIDNDDLYLSDITNIDVKFITANFFKVAGNKSEQLLEDEVVSRLVRGNPDDPEGFWPMSYVYNLMPRKPGSRAKRHSLIFRPSNWILCPSETTVDSYKGFCCYVKTGEIGDYQVDGAKYNIYKFPNIAIVSDKTVLREAGKEELIELACGLVGNKDDYYKIISRLANYPPSFLKSLLQKIIRYRPGSVDGISSPVTLLATFIALYCHAGAFVPDIQRFVSGKESALKRLAVSIIEDSYTQNSNCLHSLLAVALLTRENIHYYPMVAEMTTWMKTALESLYTSNYYNYDTHATGIFEGCYGLNYLLTNIGSFQTDINMVSSITGHTESKLNCELKDMSFAHAVDQHCFPDLAWFVADTSLTYPELFRNIWQNVSCLNPRKDIKINEEFRKKIAGAQRLFIEAKEVTPKRNY